MVAGLALPDGRASDTLGEPACYRKWFWINPNSLDRDPRLLRNNRLGDLIIHGYLKDVLP